MTVNIKKCKHCAFCNYWHDPLNRCIFPSSIDNFLWEINPKVQRRCLKKGIETQSIDSCPEYKLKISVKP